MNYETLWEKALIVTKEAILNSSLTPLETKSKLIKNHLNEYFELRQLKSTKLLNKIFNGPKPNPFYPWDSDLEISSIFDSHELILNKYPVQLGHMLLITNTWKPQIGWLEKEDFKALISVNSDTSGLWFFNSGPKAGASQPHRHIQLLPRKSTENICPRYNWFIDNIHAQKNPKLIRSALKGSYLVEPITDELNDYSGTKLYESYKEICNSLEIGNPLKDINPKVPYNLLLTNNWISLFKRYKESAFGFPINSLGFAGYLLSTNHSNLKWLNENGLEKLLSEVVDTL